MRNKLMLLGGVVLGLATIGCAERKPGTDLPAGPQPAAIQAATKPKGPEQYEATMKKFEAYDKEHPPAKDPTVFVGSSSFTKWTALETEFKQFHAINRGFGGSNFPDLLYWYDHVVAPYKPAKVVVYEGTNDAAEKHTAEQIFGDAKTFAEKVRKDFPEAQIYFLALTPAPVRASIAKPMDDANALLQDYVKTDGHLHYIDIRKLLVDAEGNPDPKYYLKDRLHPNADGYAKWLPVITAALEAPTGAANKP